MTPPPTSAKRPWHWPARLGLGLLALAVLALPFYAATQYYLYQKYLSPQSGPPVVRIDAAQAASWTAGARSLPASTAPVVLTYHDIGYSKSPYVVTPEAFDRQLSALQQAGYRSLTADEFVDYLDGGPAPPRSVLITFDDGPHGLWVYGDRIMARHHMHGTVFLITGRVNHDRPYYLSWNEVARMAASGRWDFQDHTHDLHHRAAVDAAGHTASALANRLWLPQLQRLETDQEYVQRVTGDIQQSFADLAAHGLPRPKLFAYPFSEATERANIPTSSVDLQQILSRYFVATMTDVSSRPLTASRRAAGQHQVQRLEVLGSTAPSDLLAKLAMWTQVGPDAPDPLADAAQWRRYDGTGQTGIGPLVGQGPYPATSRYVAANYRSMSSLDWTGYQVTAHVRGLGDGTNQASVLVRTDSADPVSAAVSQGFLILSQNGADVAVRKIASSATHTLVVKVSGAATTATVDGTTSLSWTPKNVTASELTGGVGIRVGVNRAHVPWPAFTALSVSPLAAARDAGSGQSVTDAVLLDPGAQWLTAPGVPAPFRISRTELAPTGRTLSVYGAYQPQQTGGWTDYQVTGTVARLTNAQVSAALWVRVGSPLAISVQVWRGRLEVFSGSADDQTLVATRTLSAAPAHRLQITVTASSTVITVDGSSQVQLRAQGERGGVAVSAYRDLLRRAWPTVRELAVAPVAGR